jgi:DNA repair protein RecO (recombination protein O)
VRAYKTEGIILKRSNYGEADRLLTIFTKNHGKLRVIAKGVRRITSRRGGNLELFNHVSVYLNNGKNLDSLSEVEVFNSFSDWRTDLKAVGVAYYLCELVDKLTAEGQEHNQVFDLLKQSLSKLDECNYTNLVVSFEKELITELGFGIPDKLRNSRKSIKNYIEEITEKKITSPKIIREIW